MLVRFFTLSGILLSLLAGISFSEENLSIEVRMARYVIGVKAIDESFAMPQNEKISYYRKLEELTKINAKQFSDFMQKFKYNPEGYKKFMELVEKNF